MTTTDANRTDVPTPAGAANVEEWADVGYPGQFRTFTGPKRTIRWNDADAGYPEEATLYVSGSQLVDGTIEGLRGVRIDGIGWEDSLPANTARELSRMLADLADEIDRWSAR